MGEAAAEEDRRDGRRACQLLERQRKGTGPV